MNMRLNRTNIYGLKLRKCNLINKDFLNNINVLNFIFKNMITTKCK